jgi:hypothetical protein
MADKVRYPGYSVFLTGIEFAWIYPLASLATSVFPHFRQPSMPAALAAIALFALVTLAIKGKGLRRIFGLFAHLAALAATLAGLLLQRYGRLEAVPWRAGGLQAAEPALLALWTGFAWYRIRKRLRDPASPQAAGNALDAGLALLVCTILLGWVAHLPPTRFVPFVLILFGCGAGALLVSNRGESDLRRYHDGGQGSMRTSSLLPFVALVVLLALIGGIWALGRDGLALASRAGLDALGKGGSFLLSIFAWIIRALSGRGQARTVRAEEPAFQNRDGAAPEVLGSSPFDAILKWAILIIAGIGVLVVLALAITAIARWLVGRDQVSAPRTGEGWRQRIRRLSTRLMAWITRTLTKISGTARIGEPIEVKAYRHLLRWGRIASRAPLERETALDYAKHLGAAFPEIEAEAKFIAMHLGVTLYGPKKVNAHTGAGRSPEDVHERTLLHRAAARFSAPLLRIIALVLGRFLRFVVDGARGTMAFSRGSISNTRPPRSKPPRQVR